MSGENEQSLMKLALMFDPAGGDYLIDHNPLEEIALASDRACALVVASICEMRLEHALRKFFDHGDSEMLDNVFRPDSILGNFRAKINIAYLSKIISRDACHDLVIVSKIRNKFAHDFKIISFQEQFIRDRCKNLILPEKHYMNIEYGAGAGDIPPADHFTMLQSGLAEAITDARSRYTASCMLVANCIAMSLHPRSNHPMPYI